tara:strand:+ start:108 stop:371 length:264 start_codon:yes stop_codon:yes gene_type:complete
MIVSIFSTITLFYALRRINQYENLILQFQQIIKFSSEKMKLVDYRGHYESDDETGFFFQQLKDLQNLLDGVFENELIQEKNNDSSKK